MPIITKPELAARWNIDFKSLKLPIGPAQIDWAFARIEEEVAKALAGLPPPPAGGISDEDKEYINEQILEGFKEMLQLIPPPEVLLTKAQIEAKTPLDPLEQDLGAFVVDPAREFAKYGANEFRSKMVDAFVAEIHRQEELLEYHD